MMNSAYQLKKIRWALRLSVRDFAELINISERSLRRMQQGSKYIPPDVIDRARGLLDNNGDRI